VSARLRVGPVTVAEGVQHDLLSVDRLTVSIQRLYRLHKGPLRVWFGKDFLRRRRLSGAGEHAIAP
jgi:hypothetical protein